MGQVVFVAAGEWIGLTFYALATEIVVGVRTVLLHGKGTTLFQILATAQGVVGVSDVFPLSVGTALGVSCATGLFQGVARLLVVLAALGLLGVILAAGCELRVIDAVHRGVDTVLVADIALRHAPVRNDGTALRFVLIALVLDDLHGAGLDLLAVGSIGHVLGEEAGATTLVVIRLDDLVVALGVDENTTAAVLVLVVDYLLGQDVLAS